jgi:hypothetical protein
MVYLFSKCQTLKSFYSMILNRFSIKMSLYLISLLIWYILSFIPILLLNFLFNYLKKYIDPYICPYKFEWTCLILYLLSSHLRVWSEPITSPLWNEKWNWCILKFSDQIACNDGGWFCLGRFDEKISLWRIPIENEEIWRELIWEKCALVLYPMIPFCR